MLRVPQHVSRSTVLCLCVSVQDAACSTIHQDTAEASEVVAGTAQEAQSVAGSSVSPLSPRRSGSSISTGI